MIELDEHYQHVLEAVFDNTCFVSMSGTLMNLSDMGMISMIDPCAEHTCGWKVTQLGDVTVRYYRAARNFQRESAEVVRLVEKTAKLEAEVLCCDRCGEDHDPNRVFGEVQYCRRCLAAEEYRVEHLTHILKAFVNGGSRDSLLRQCEGAGIHHDQTVMHFALEAGLSRCGEYGPNEGRTTIRENVTCRDCRAYLARGKVIELKTWPTFFQEILDGDKTFELRKNDRNFRPGDILRLREWDMLKEQYTGRVCDVIVTYILAGTGTFADEGDTRGSGFGLPHGMCIMSIVKLSMQVEPGRPHIVNGRFQSDKYPSCPPGKVPLSTSDEMAQDLLHTYAQRRRAVDPEFAADLEHALQLDGFKAS